MEIKHRDLIFVILMTVLTLGFYYIYWTVKTKNEIKSLGCYIPSAVLAFIPIIHFYFWYQYSIGFVDCVEKQKDNSTLIILYTLCLSFIPLIGILIIQNRLNQIATIR
jgi:hypothetical protein